MTSIGFSTGALALGDFHNGLSLQRRENITAVELSALRENELDVLIDALPTLDLAQFKFVSFHAPSRLIKHSNVELVNKLRRVAELDIPIVVHPDIIDDCSSWRSLGSLILLENMDQRKRVCRTADEMQVYFEKLPEARFCFDIGHARQLDPTMSIAVDLLLRFQSRLAEIHASEVSWDCRHVSISSAAALAYSKIAALVPEQTPIIIESLIPPEQITAELNMVRDCFSTNQPLFTFARQRPNAQPLHCAQNTTLP
jgi:hypothetical protein